MRTVTIKVKDEIYELAEEMVKLGIVNSKNEAFNLVMEKGLREVIRVIEEERRANELAERWLKEGLPRNIKVPTSEELIRERE
ncbi:hypothetical protein L3N51_02379 [Metallosphaera sp. J1]|uniref:VapB-type antitoxin n=1 Tax=Metallosphaera TaxID=41980 RepID=UPI001EE10875|nr:VapB-type antitoxin [Metallosphaera javensis (ex Hofmann et al. 2022)]MCG3110082.1 hypothetical protein [Metallosphaera javensis (ex Hofmann et al. 2022)]BCS93135.1 MAG: hypothetical protein MjAS7_1743 [Metallosphaera javensis (ex Sakai et al. 2022)]